MSPHVWNGALGLASGLSWLLMATLVCSGWIPPVVGLAVTGLVHLTLLSHVGSATCRPKHRWERLLLLTLPSLLVAATCAGLGELVQAFVQTPYPALLSPSLQLALVSGALSGALLYHLDTPDWSIRDELIVYGSSTYLTIVALIAVLLQQGTVVARW